jgi:hypothetical protein
MNSLLVMYTTAALMAIVASACTMLCLVWSIPSWRCRLASPRSVVGSVRAAVPGLTGWSAHVGSGLISAGIAACAVVGWYGCYCILNGLSYAAR